MMIRRLCYALLLLAATALPAAADPSWKQSSAIWAQMDKCAQQARKAFPDYTREANAKREAARQKCLRGASLPGEADVAPPAPAPAASEVKQAQ
jgi:hypothetical protein